MSVIYLLELLQPCATIKIQAVKNSSSPSFMRLNIFKLGQHENFQILSANICDTNTFVIFAKTKFPVSDSGIIYPFLPPGSSNISIPLPILIPRTLSSTHQPPTPSSACHASTLFVNRLINDIRGQEVAATTTTVAPNPGKPLFHDK